MDDARIEALLVDLTARTFALRDILVVLLAQRAHQSSDPEKAFKSLSNGLSRRIDEMTPLFAANEAPLLEKIRAEIDQIVEMAQALVQRLPK